MVEASKDTKYSDLGYGDETRRNGDYVGLPHDQDNGGANAVLPGQVVSMESGVLAKGDGTGGELGVLVDYQRYGDSGGPDDPGTIKQDQNATVKVGGVVKAEVDTDVSAGDFLTIGDTSNGVFGNSAPDTDSRFLALTDAVEDERYDGTQAFYAEVLIQ